MLTIGEVARRAGVAASALRYYEREGLIPKADRRGGKRVYGEDILDRLALIAVAKGGGFTVAAFCCPGPALIDATPLSKETLFSLGFQTPL